MKTRVLFATAALAALVPLTAGASSFRGELSDGTDVSAEFTVVDAGLRKAETTLVIGGETIPRARRFCLDDQGGYRCPHRNDDFSAELYPRLNSEGDLRLHIILYGRNGRDVESVVLDEDQLDRNQK